jgi:hypothetical protein
MVHATQPTPGLPALKPLPHHTALVHYLRTEEPEVWNWASSAQAREEHAEAVRNELLKQTYRLDADAHPELHRHGFQAAQRLGLDARLTLYQANDGSMNATLYSLPGEAHIVFAGPVLERLKGAELEALLGHELSHQLLWEMDDGAYHAADRVLSALLHDPRASDSQLQSARLFRLYTEVFADRGGALACGGLLPAITALVKTQTGLRDVSAASYLKQADEICAGGQVTTEGGSHPEVFIRSRALRLWCEADPSADTWLETTLEGPLSSDKLDLLGQQRLTALTQRLLAQLLQRRCLRSDALLAHARLFFPDFEPDESVDPSLAEIIAATPGIHAYVATLLMDFTVCDRELEDVPLAASLELSERLVLLAEFERFALKELRMPKRQFNKIKQEATDLLKRAEQKHG